jgi:hypothetical protein
MSRDLVPSLRAVMPVASLDPCCEFGPGANNAALRGGACASVRSRSARTGRCFNRSALAH